METKLTFPDGWESSTSWKRAQSNQNSKNPVNEKEWIVKCKDGDRHRVTFYIKNSSPSVQCDCKGYHYFGCCAHILSLWWDWVRGKAVVTDIDSGKQLLYPPFWIEVSDNDE
jgi:hypothetical protein